MRAGRADGETWLRLSEAAALLGISLNTLRRWSDSGKLACYRSPGGHRRYRRGDIEALLRRQAEREGPGGQYAAQAIASGPGDGQGPSYPALSTLARLATEAIGVSACILATLDEDRLRVASVYPAAEIGASVQVGDVLTRDQAPLADEVLHTQRRAVIADIGSTNLLTPAEIAACRDRSEAAVIALPLVAAGRLCGVLQLVERRAPRAFTGADVAFAEFVARQAAAVVVGAEGGRPPRDDGRPLADAIAAGAAGAIAVSAPPVAGDRDAPLFVLADGLRRRLGAVACDVLALARDRDDGPFTVVVAAEDGRDSASLDGLTVTAADLGPARACLTDRAVVAVPLAADSATGVHRARVDGSGARHVVAAPLLLGDEALGIVEVYAATPDRDYSRDETALIEAVSTGLALALESTRETRRLTERVRGLDALLERAAVPASERDQEDCLRAFLCLAADLAPHSTCAVYEVTDGRARRLAGDATHPTEMPAPGAEAMAPGSGREPAASDVTYDPAATTDGAAGPVLALPLHAGSVTVGLVRLAGPSATELRDAERTLRPATELLAATLAARGVAATLRRRTHDLEVVMEAGLEDTWRLSTDEVLHTVIQRLSELTGSPVADVYAVEDGTLRALISYDGGRFDPEWEGVVVPLSRYPCSLRAVETREIAVAASLDAEILGPDGRFSLERWGYQSQLSMPLVAGDSVIGLVELSDYVPRDFAGHLGLIRGLGKVAAQALANARLFEQVERRSRILNELVDLGTFASTCPDIDTVLRRVAERLLRTIDAANCDIYQMSGEGLRCVVSHDRSGFDEAAVGRILDVTTYPTVVEAIASGRLLVITGPDDPQLCEREREVYREYGFNSEVCVPLIVNDELFGLIDIYDTRPRDYSEYLSFLRSLGMGLAGAFASTMLLAQLEHRTKVLRELVDLGALASGSGELSELMATLAGRLRTTIAAADCDIYALEGTTLRCLASVDERGPADGATGEALEISDLPVAEIAARTREPVAVSDLDDPRITDHERRRFAAWGYRSLLCVPLLSGDETVGIVDVFDTRRRDYGDYLDFMRSAGQIVAGAIRNAALVTELTTRNHELAELVGLGRQATTTSGLTRLLEAVAARVTEVAHAAGCQVFGREGEEYRCLFTWEDGAPSAADIGHLLDFDRFPTMRRCLEERQTLVVAGPDAPSLSESERAHYRETEWRSDIVVPLLVDERLVGLLEVYDRRPRDYHEHHDFLRQTAQIVAGALENTQLLERLERANRQLRNLVDAGLDFGASLEPDAVLRSVAERLCVAADATCCDIYRLEGDAMRCLVSVDKGRLDGDFAGTTYEIRDFIGVRDSVTVGRPVAVSDMLGDERVSAFEREENLRWGHRAKVELPLVARGEVVGLASIFDERPRDFDDLDLLQSLAQVAANALANATLYDELDRSADRVALVGDVSFELSSSLDLGEVLQNTANRLCALADMPCCDIYTLDADRRLTCVVSLVEGETDTRWQGSSFPVDDWAAVRSAVDRRMPIVISSPDDPLLNEDERRLMREYDETAEVIFPLVSKDVVIGVLELLENRGPRTFDQDEIATIAAVCRVAALAIDNADLVSDLQLRNRETELLNEIARAVTASLDLATVAESVVQQLEAIVPLHAAMLALRRGDAFETVYVSSPSPTGHQVMDTAHIGALAERLERERVVVLERGERDGLVHPGTEELGAVAIIGISAGDGITGVLGLGAEDAGAFSDVDRRLLERIGTQLGPAISNAQLYEDIKRMHLGNLKALSSALNAKDYYTLGHAARVAAYMVLLGEELGWEPELLRRVEEAAYLHDIGKIGVSDRVLLKPSGLNPREWELMRQHPVFSADIIRPLFDDQLTLGVRHHHEHYDGTGYPEGLAGAQIPYLARAMCVVDSYDAMSFRRPYRQALGYAACREELRRCAGSQFDPDMVQAFERVLEDLAQRKASAETVAIEAAARLDVAAHATLRRPEDEESDAYRAVVAELRAVRNEHPPTRFLTTFVRHGSSAMLVADAEEEEGYRSHLGDERFADEEVLQVLAGETVDRTVLFVDQFGVWISGAAPVRDERGDIVAATSADLPVTSGVTDVEGLRSDVTQTFADLVADAAARLGQAEVEAITDGLTGLYNHRYLHERLEEEIERCVRSGGSLALLLIDLDDFRSFNERYGHRAGDRALRSVARVVEGSLRQVDLAARFGGEEFAAILIDADEAGALEVAERIRNGIVATEVTRGHESLSVSVGLALCPADAAHKEELLDKADWAMYLAKRRGRDQVVSFGAEHGALTPEQAALVHDDHVSDLGSVVAARDAYMKRRRAAVTDLALALARELGLEAEAMHDVAVAAAAACDQTARRPDGDGGGADGSGAATGARVDGVSGHLAAVAATYESLVTASPYRPGISEAEAFEEVRRCPALSGEPRLLAALESVLAQRRM